jgi:hypothetical protein
LAHFVVVVSVGLFYAGRMNQLFFPTVGFYIVPEASADGVVKALGFFEDIEAERALTFYRCCLFRNVVDHAAVWILIVCSHNFELENGCGYTVVSWPKKMFPQSVMAETMTKFTASIGADKLPDKKD